MAEFYFIIAMIKADNSSTAKRAEFESNIPALEINPVSVGATENDTKIEWVEDTLKVLIELSWVEETLEQLLDRLHLRKATLEDWTVLYISTDDRRPLDPIKEFLHHYYEGEWAYLRTPTWDLYWQVKIWPEGEMKTEKWILTMPTVIVGWERIFFPVDAILSSSEKNLYDIYMNWGTDTTEKDNIEKQIMDLLIRLSTINNDVDIVWTNKFTKDIVSFCEQVWTVRKLDIDNWVISIQFWWRKAVDTSWQWGNYVVLPPCLIRIDIRDRVVKGGEQYHPHILHNHELCMGWVLTDMVNQAMTKQNLKGLVECMVQFWNSYTSSDCHFSWERCPAQNVLRYLANHSWDDDYEKCEVRVSDIFKTILDTFSTPREECWSKWRETVKEHLLVWDEEWMEMAKAYKEKNWSAEFLIRAYFWGSDMYENMRNKYSEFLTPNEEWEWEN